MNKPATYFDDKNGVDLEASRSRLLFKALLLHGPGFDEAQEYRIGPTKCGLFDVLWIKSDWIDDGPSLQPIAWLPRYAMKGKALHLALLRGWLEAEKQVHEADGPNFSEVISDKQARMSTEDVLMIVDEVFGT